ncbi:DUF58 domain-containing protein [Aliiglaciecola sp. M165]|uniref:DUF58 domain-containing protein n=1 Tax=Aliiglaciecola sp. M165 TaxID=2593649 RepID=UPI0011805A52|nr:DUF58 domain-containing protein [Aliiglaciecola sp. M165]TRY29328.1 DUF58 domain-containing protein [Aliiglaciecola sp. M165]
MSAMQSRIAIWLDRRIPAARRFKLNHRTIFIFPSRFGGLYLFLCLGLFLLGTNYQNNLMILLCYFLISLFLINLLAAYFNFSNLDIQLGKVQNSFAGDNIQVPIWFNHRDKESHGKIHLSFWRHREKTSVDLDALANPAFIALACPQRGRLPLPRVTFSSYFPLGLYRCWTHLAFQSDIVVYPKPVRCPIRLENKSDEQEQHHASVSVKGHDDFDTLAPYKQGEPLYHVAWKQVAKGQGMLSKQFSHETGASGWLMMPKVASENLELTLSQLCYQVMELSRKNQRFGLDLGNSKIAPDSGNDHQKNCLIALALYGKRG